MPNKNMERYSNFINTQEKRKLKSLQDTATNPLEQLKLNRVIPEAGKDKEQQKFSDCW